HHLEARLNALLARQPGSPFAAPDGVRPLPVPAKLDFTALADRARAKNPQLFAEDARLKAAEKSRDLTYKNRYPDFTLGVSPIQYQSTVKEWELMVEMNIPLQQGSRRAQERESEAMVAAAQARREATSNQVLADLAENLAGIEAARRTEILVANSLLPQAELTFQAALAGYETGRVDFATLLDAQRQIRQAKQNQIKAQAEAQARLADIERILGEEL
ncbi:MAG TPA: TolC family protein, partial [Rhodocyclaceae bacterium]|nr:TolC family protein [Rhodocyclaceae bacterium]